MILWLRLLVRTLILWQLLLCAGSVWAQKRKLPIIPDKEIKGWIILNSGDTLYGNVEYLQAEDIIKLQTSDNQSYGFNALNVATFFLAGSKGSIMYKSYLWNRYEEQDHQTPTFFRHLTQGKYCLVSRYSNAIKNLVTVDHWGTASLGNYQDLTSIYFLTTPENKVIPLRNLKLNAHKVFGDKSEEMRLFIKKQHLDYEDERDLIQIVKYYNQIQK